MPFLIALTALLLAAAAPASERKVLKSENGADGLPVLRLEELVSKERHLILSTWGKGSARKVSEWIDGKPLQLIIESDDTDDRVVTSFDQPRPGLAPVTDFEKHAEPDTFLRKEVVVIGNTTTTKTVYERKAGGEFREASHSSSPNKLVH